MENEDESESIIPATQLPPSRPTSTQARSTTNYQWVILFVWLLSEERPFLMVPLGMFRRDEDTDFPMHLITGPLSDKSRCNQYKLEQLSGHMYSVFCKIEVGIDAHTRRGEVMRLNDKYAALVRENECSMSKNYLTLVKSESYCVS